MSIEQLFCTPDQGRRLKELVPELTSVLIWVFINHEQRWARFPIYVDKYKNHYRRWYSKQKDMDEFVHDSIRHKSAAPALTLQELRDVYIQRLSVGCICSVRFETLNLT
jgi:hypothetical protein